MIQRAPRPTTGLVLCALTVLILSTLVAEAQTRRAPAATGHRAVPRPGRVAAPPTRVIYFRGYGYRPYFYGFYDPFFYGPYPYPYPYYGIRSEQSAVRLEVQPEETEVYVDGYYAGVVDSYDGFFQRLHLPPGEHEIELYLEGYESARETVYLAVGETYRIRHEMVRLADGEPQPPRPEPVDPPPHVDDATEQAGPPLDRRFVAERFGTLAVRVQPVNAQVWIDGELWQGFEEMERLVVELGIGSHPVEVRRDGYRTFQTVVDILEGDTTLLNVSLPRLDDDVDLTGDRR